MMLLHTPGFSEAASGGDSQRSGLVVRRNEVRAGTGGWLKDDALELERVFAPDVSVGVHRVDGDRDPVPWVDAIRDQTQTRV